MLATATYYRYLILALTGVMSASVSAEGYSYLCVTEESTGFYYENGSWGRAYFDASDDKYILRRYKEDDIRLHKGKDYSYGLFDLDLDFGGKYATSSCRPSLSNRHIICDKGVTLLYFALDSGRFLATYMRGFWSGEDNNDNTPYISRGKCSKI